MTSPSDKSYSAVRTARAKRESTSGRERKRRLALDVLEPRTLMSVLPPPQIVSRANLSNTPGSEDTAPSISVDPLDPLRAVAVWSHATNPLEANPLPIQYRSLGEGAYTTDGGLNWAKFSADTIQGYTYSLPSPLPNPANGTPSPTSQYSSVTDLTVGFDRQHDVFILGSQHTPDFKSGALVLQKYNFSGATPNLTLANKIVHQWIANPNQVSDFGDQAHNPTLAVDTNVGNGQTNMPAGSPAGIVTGPDGNTYVAIQDLNQVQQLQGSSGLFTSIFASGVGLYAPSQLAFNPQDGALYISNGQNAEVLRVDGATGRSLGTFTQGLVSPKSPRDMVIGPVDKNLYVSSKDTGSVLRYNAATGVFLGSFIAPNSGGLLKPEGLAFGADGNLYVADSSNNTVLRYDGTTGAPLGVFVTVANNGGLDDPRGIVFGPDKNLYVVSQATNQVLRYNRNTGGFLGAFAQPGPDPQNDLNSPTSLVFSPIDGNLLVTSFNPGVAPAGNKSEILRYNGSTGTFISSFLAPPLGGLDRPTGIAFRLGAASGHDEIVVGSERTNTILRFDANTGVYLGPLVPQQTRTVTRFDSKSGLYVSEAVPIGSGSLQVPTGFAFANDSTAPKASKDFGLYVSSGASDEILHYDANGNFLAAITPEPLNAPTDAVLGADGFLYAVSRDTDSVVRYDSKSGKYLGTFIASGSGGLNVPTALAFTPDNASLLVASSFDSSVLRYSSATGAFQGVFIQPTPATNGGLNDPEGLVFRNGNLYVTSTKGYTVPGVNGAPDTVLTSGVVLEYNGTGAFIKPYTPEPLLAPESAVIGLDGNLYVSSSVSNEVIKYDGKSGRYLSVFVPADPSLNGGLTDPRGIVFNSTLGQMYVSSYGTGRVLKYDAATGAYLGLITTEPLTAPQGAVFSNDGKTFYVASRDSNAVLKYDAATGKFLGDFVSSNPAANGGLTTPVGLAFDAAGNLYVSSRGTNQVLRYQPNGAFDGVFASSAPNSGGPDLIRPEYLAFDAAGRLYVSAIGTDEVLRFKADGSPAPGGTNPRAQFVAPGQGGLNGPEGLAFDAAGNLYVASNFNNQVLKFSPSGGDLGVFVADTTQTAGVQTGVFNPVGLAFHNAAGTNYLYVSGGTGDRSFVQIYNAADGKFAGSAVLPGGGGLDGATGLVFSPVDGSLLVGNAGTNTVLKFTGVLGTDVAGSFTPPTLPTPDGLTLDSTNSTLYVVSHDAGRVFKYKFNGATADFAGFQDPEPLVNPQDIAVSPADATHFYVASSGGDEILRYNLDGSFDKVFIPQGAYGIRNPKGLAFDATGNLFVVSQGTALIRPAIYEFDATGKFLKIVVSPVTGPGLPAFYAVLVPPTSPTPPSRYDGIAVDPAGFLFVADAANNVVLRYDNKGLPAPSGTNPGAIFIPTQGGLNIPSGLSVTGTTLTVVNAGNGQVITYNEATGATIATIINDNKNLIDAGREILGPDGNYYVTSPGRDQVVRFRPVVPLNGTFVFDAVLTMPPALSPPGPTSTPTGLALLGTNNLLVGNFDNQVVLRHSIGGPLSLTRYTTEPLIRPEDITFAADGTSLLVSNTGSNDILKFDTKAMTSTTFALARTPQGVAIGPDGNLYVSDEAGNQVLRYDGVTGAFIDIFVRSGAGGLHSPQGLTFVANVGLLVVSRDTGQVLLYNPVTGAFLREFTPEPLRDPQGLTFNAGGNLFVASHGSNRVLQYDTTGNFLSKFTSDDPYAPQGAVLGPDGNLYVASRDTNEVIRYYGPGAANNKAGTFLDVFVPTGVGGLIAPTGLVFGTDGNLYVASSGSNEVLSYVGGSGAFIKPFVRFQVDANNLPLASASINPQALTIDASGNLYVSTGSQVQQYRASSGAYIGAFVAAGAGGLSGAEGIAFSDTNFDGKPEFYVASSGSDQVLQYDGVTGVFRKIYVQSGTSSANNLDGPSGIAFAPDQTLYVSSSLNSEVIRYQAATGSFLDVFVTANRGGLSTPEGVVIDSKSNQLLVSSSDTGQVLSYSLSKGTFNGPFTPGPLVAPTRAAFGPDGNLYVSSEGYQAKLGDPRPNVLSSVIKYEGATGRSLSNYVGGGSGGLLGANGLVFTADGSLLVSSRDSDTILRYNPGTGLINDSFQPGAPIAPTFQTFNPADGLIYVSSTLTNSVLRYDPATGKLVGTFVAGNPALNGGLNSPQGVVFGPDGNLYVASSGTPGSFASKVIRYNGKTGQFIDTFVATGNANLSRALGLTFYQGDLYVASYGNDRVIRYGGQNGSYLSDYVSARSGGLRGPTSLAFDAAGFLYVGSSRGTITPGPLPGPASDQPDSILRYKPITGNFDSVFVAPGTGGLDGPTALAFDAAGNLYVASDAQGFSFLDTPEVSADSQQDNRVLKFGPTGALIGTFIARGAGGLSGPSGLAFDGQGNLIVSSRNNDQILKFSPSGTFTSKLDATPAIAAVAIAPLIPDGKGGVAAGDVNGDGVLDVFASATDLDSVQVYDGRTGEYVKTLVAPRLAGLSAPKDLIFSADGKSLYVASSGNHRVNVYDATTGAFSKSFSGGGLLGPDGLIIRNGVLYAAGTASNSVVGYNLASGAVVLNISAGLAAPKGVAFDSAGNLLVSSFGGGDVLKFNAATGASLGVYNRSAPPGFVDPTRNKIQNDAFSNSVYVAWATNVLGDLHDSKTDQVAAIVLTQSSDGGRSFAPRQVLNDSRYSSPRELDAAPRLSISQGRLPGTLSPSDPGVPGGQVNAVWTDFGTNDFRTPAFPQTDAIVTDRVQAGVSYSATANYTAIDAKSAIETDPLRARTTQYPLSVDVSDPRFTSLSHVAVRLSLIHPTLQNLKIEVVAPDGTRVTLLGRGRAIGVGLGLQPIDPANSNGPFTIDTVFDDQAPRNITNVLYAAPFTGGYRPDDTVQLNLDGLLLPYTDPAGNRVPNPGLSAFNGMSRTSANGIWNLEITDYSSLATATVRTQRVLDWGLDLSTNMTDSKDVTVVAADKVTTRLERYNVKGIAYTGPLALSSNGRAPTLPGEIYSGVDPAGIAPAPVLASDNTLGAFSPYQGRIYLAYVDSYIHDEFSGFQPGDDTNIYLKYSDDGGLTWNGDSKLGNGDPKLVNDDNGKTDGFSEADISGNIDNGRPQFQPSIAVDASTGTLALSFFDARYDPQHARVAMFVATSSDGGDTFAPQTFVNTPQLVTDGITGLPVTLGPIPDNQSLISIMPWITNGTGDNVGPGYGASQGLAFVGGHLYPAWASNQNRGPSGRDQLDIRVASTTVAGGPRIVSSTMGPVASQTVHALDNTELKFNNQTASGVAGVADGTPLADGFVITFDRPVDPATLNPALPPARPIVTVLYRDVFTSGFDNKNAKVVPVSPVITPLLEGNTPQGPTKFLVRFTPQGRTGTYSYQVGPAIRDLIRTVTSDGKVVSGNLMDQNGNAVGGEDPRSTLIVDTSPGDIYSTPRAQSTVATNYSLSGVVPPFDRTTQPLIVSGPHVVSTAVVGSVKTPDNLVVDKTVGEIAITFDRDMDASTLTGSAVLRVLGPYGVIPGPYTVRPQPGQGARLRTFLIGFPVQQVSGTYLATLAATVRSSTGEALDTNQNAGLDMLRGDPTAGTTVVTFTSADATPPVIGGPVAGRVTTSIINVPENFIVQKVTVAINITYPFDPDLHARLIAPDGKTSVRLFDNVGQAQPQANFTNTLFVDVPGTPIQDGGPPFFGTYNPQSPLSKFRDSLTTAGGNWTLEITDDGVGRTGTINSWTLNLTKPIPATGLGDPVADQATVSFRIFTQDPTNLLSSNTFTAVGPAGIGAKGPGLNAEISGRVGAIAVDPSDPSGNTVYIGASSGGIWKTQNFLTTSPTGPVYIPLTDFGPTLGINVGSVAVFGRNNDPNQSIIIAATGDPDALGVQTPGAPARGDSPSLTARGIGFLRSMDGGATWVLLDSSSNFDAAGKLLPLDSLKRDHVFVGTAGFKVTVDPKVRFDGEVNMYAALSDVDPIGQPVTGIGRAGGLWRSTDTGRTWTKQRAGQATDVLLDFASGTGTTEGNLQILYAAFKGEGVFRSPNSGGQLDLMTGTAGNPLIQSFDSNPTQAVPVLPAKPSPYNGLTNPNSAQGRIVLARPALTGNPLQDVLYQGWLYAAVVSSPSVVTADNQLVVGGHLAGLYLTKDIGQNWTRVLLPAFSGGTGIVPSTDDRLAEFDPLGNSTPAGVPVLHPPDLNNFGTGNFNISLAVDPNNPNIVYLGGTSQFNEVGLMRIDTTGVADPHAFYQSQNDPEGKIKTIAAYGLNGERSIWVGWPILSGLPTQIHGPTVLSNPGQPLSLDPDAPFDPAHTPFLNLIANPRTPFKTAATIPVTNTMFFMNSGAKAKWTAFDHALKPDTFAVLNDNPDDPNNAWATPTRGVHRIVTMVDPQTGKTRLIFGDDNGVFTAVDKGDGSLIGSLGSVASLDNDRGDVKVATGSRNGNLQTAKLFYGASEPSTDAARASRLKGLFYGSTDAGGTPYSNANVLSPGQVGYGDITWARPFIERTSGVGIATVQTGPLYPGFGSFYRYILPSEMDHLTGPNPSTVTDFLQRDLTSRTFNLLQNTSGQFDPAAQSPIFDVPDGQWPFRQGYNFAVNPLSGEQLLISSNQGRVFSTENQGKFWNVIGNPAALDSSYAQALAYGAPDVNNAGLGNLNSFVYAGTIRGNIFVTFNGGGSNGNQWIPLSAGLDRSPIQQIITNPTRTSHEAYAVTQRGVYHMVDSKAINATWVNITGNLFQITAKLFNDPAQVQARLRNLTTVQADWRYIIPNNFNQPTGPTHPMLYVGGEGGIFRSLDNGTNWSFFPSADLAGFDATPTPPGDGGGLPNALVTDIDLVLGNIDPTNGRPDISTGPNTLLATTFGRGAFTIRLAPTVFPITAANPTAIHLSTTTPAPGGSDSGLSNSDQITSLTQPFIDGFSAQSAFGSVVTVSLFDMTDGSKAPVFIGSDKTDAAGRFSVQVNALVYKADGSTDGVKLIGVQATDQASTKGNLARFSFTLDTTRPVKPPAPILSPASDTGRFNNDSVTTASSPIFDLTGIEPTARVALFRDGGAKAVGTRIGNGTVQDGGPLSDGVHTYFAVQEDVAGNFSVASDSLSITVDTTAPLAPIAPDLAPTSDSGLSSTDDYTNATSPSFNLVAAEPTAQVILLRKLASEPFGSYVAVGSIIGSGTVQDPGPVADGVYTYAATQIDLAGNVGPIGPSLTVTIDTASEGPPTGLVLSPTLPAPSGSDSGISNADGVTSVNRPFFNVTAFSSPTAVTRSQIQLVRKLRTAPDSSYIIVGQTPATVGATVAIQDAGPVPDGVYDYATQQIDLAGNLGVRSVPLIVTIDTTPAINALALVLDSKSDSGSSNSDQITNAAAPFFIVTTAEANVTVQLFRKALGAATYASVGLPRTISAPGVGQLQDPSAPPNGVFVYSVQATDAAGNVGSVGVVTTTVTFDNVPPGIPPAGPDLTATSDSGISSTDNITNSTAPVFSVLAADSTATIQLLRKVRGTLDPSYVIVGSVVVGSTTVPGLVTDSKLPVPRPDGAYTYTIRQLDLAGNLGPIGGTLDVTIDATPPAVPTLFLDAKDDTGTQGDSTTSVLRPRVSGKTEAGASLVLSFTTGGILATGVAAPDGTFTLTPNLDLSPDGVYRLVVNAADVAGNLNPSPTLVLTIDTTAPGTPTAPQLDPASDSGQSKADAITNVKTPFLIVGSTETTATVQLFRKQVGALDSTYTLVGQIVGGGKIQDTAALNLPDGSYLYAAKQSDAANNVGSFGPTLTVVFDTTSPVAAPIPRLNPSTDSGLVGDGITNFKSNRIFDLIATEATATVQLFRKLFTAPDASYTLVGTVTGSGQVTDPAMLIDTQYAYAANQVDVAGNAGLLGPAQAITILTQPPASTSLNLLAADDTGSKGDGITSVKRPRFTGGTQRSALVELLSSGSVIGSTTADSVTGTYTVQPISPLFDGTYTIQTRATDAAGNSTLSLTTILLTIDSVPPDVPALSILADDDSGTLGDRITSVRRPRLIGTTERRAKVELLDNLGAVKDSTFADATTGKFTLQPPLDLVDGKYIFQARASDLAANLATSSPYDIQIVQVAPTTPTLALVQADDSGVQGDLLTNVSRPRLTGSAGPNVSITLLDGAGNIHATTTSDATGAFTVRPATPLGDGLYKFTVLSRDALGNGGPSNVVNLTIDTVAPGPLALTMFGADDTGVKGDFVTAVRQPRLVGKSDPFGVAALYGPDGTLFSAVATGVDGSFTLQSIVPLKVGVNRLTVRTTDAAGNTSVAGAVPAITVVRTTADYDGDGRSDIAIYDAGTATFYVRFSSIGSKVLTFGNPNSLGIPVSADYDGDGKTDLAVYDPQTANYFVAYSSGGLKVIPYGFANRNNVAVPVDFDGDGRTDLAVYDQSEAKFYISLSSSGALAVVPFGTRNNRNLPVAGDYNGDGRSDIVLYDQITATFSVVLSDGSGGFIKQFGKPNSGSLPSAADYDGDGKTDLTVFEPGPAVFYQLYSNPSFQGGSKVYQYGVPNGRGIPVSADYDGDGRTDTTMFDPAEAKFYATFSAGSSKVTQFGPTGNRVVPIPSITGPGLVGAASLFGGGDRADFTPIAPPQANVAVPTVVGHLFGHPEQPKKFVLRPANRVRKGLVQLAHHKVKTAAVKPTAHDLALENLWSDGPGA